ncbi:MAG: ShlB/FhaC/HecB family hemolysin secretion/activation protein, partial [Symploca sp. SIO2E6]|nr:ShlB/FhaC/HecB family hemolysin secretion/activation protein [Symploca sp. SIO2E6]
MFFQTPAARAGTSPSLQTQNLPIPPEILQPNPNEDRFPQPAPTPEPIPDSEDTKPVSPPLPPRESTDSDSQKVQVQQIEVIDSTVFSPEELNAIVQPFEGRALTFQQLKEVADQITQLYLEKGYITSRAILVDQPIEEGMVTIRILEGSLEEIKIEGNIRVNPDYIRSRIQLGAGKPLNTADLEDQLRLLRADPLFENIEASLRMGTQQGKSILIVRIAENDPFEGSVSIDNYSPPSVGSERLGVRLSYLNLTGNGDRLATSFFHTTRSGSDVGDISYRAGQS